MGHSFPTSPRTGIRCNYAPSLSIYFESTALCFYLSCSKYSSISIKLHPFRSIYEESLPSKAERPLSRECQSTSYQAEPSNFCGRQALAMFLHNDDGGCDKERNIPLPASMSNIWSKREKAANFYGFNEHM